MYRGTPIRGAVFVARATKGNATIGGGGVVKKTPPIWGFELYLEPFDMI